MTALRLAVGPLMQQLGGGGGSDITSIDWRVLLEANRITGLSDGNSVSTWSDASGNGWHATVPGSGISAPTYKTGIVNGEPVVRFAGGGASSGEGLQLDINAAVGLTQAELFIVFKADADPPGSINNAGHPLQFSGDSTGGGNVSHLPFTDGNVYEGFGTSSRKTVGNPTPSLSSQFRCYNVRSASGAYSVHLDGSSLFSTGTNTPGFSGFGYWIGHATVARARYFDGDVAFIGIAESVLSTEDRAIVTSYIESTYGITFA